MPRCTTSSLPSSRDSSRYLPRRAVPVMVAPTTSSAAMNLGWGKAHAEVSRRPTTSGSSCRRMVSTSGSSGIDRGHASITTGTIIGRRLVDSLTKRPAARRTTFCSASMSVPPSANDCLTAWRTSSAHSASSGSASGA